MEGRKPPRRKRSVNVCHLDNETIAKLTAQYHAVDVSNTGVLSPSEVEALIKQSYAPSEEEVSNVFRCLDVVKDEEIVLDEFLYSFFRVFRGLQEDGSEGVDEFDIVFEKFAAELHHMAKQGKPCMSEMLAFSPEVVLDARKELGEEWVLKLGEHFASFSSGGQADVLARDDMALLLKAVFEPSSDKIEKVMMFFSMSGEEGITLQNFINGMTLLYGDLGHLAASPKQKSGPISPLSPPTGEYASAPCSSPFNLSAEPDDDPSPLDQEGSEEEFGLELVES